ncbi:hypothetical protein CIN_08220 [Commensalibacter intestini A911]|uniref:Protein-export membrane protein SecG n=2 Tax=Commensalibacter intestini TaxID=479936 RepID=A0A251ZXP4_9PROT|nr:preprotein translocase subunit SecG [Commensalibacter intestini]EHD14890.1 hypothetical protein CIN_08220 [Commensalibacter intestini A911]OUI79422.1 preprotein translocase subunit SecG [Commensalibacter intestini]
MTTILLIVQLLVTLALIGVVLIQRSEGGGLGIGSSQGMGSFMTGRGTTNLLTRTTAILAAVFMILCLAIAILNKNGSANNSGAAFVNKIIGSPSQQATPSQPKPNDQPQKTEKTAPTK